MKNPEPHFDPDAISLPEIRDQLFSVDVHEENHQHENRQANAGHWKRRKVSDKLQNMDQFQNSTHG